MAILFENLTKMPIFQSSMVQHDAEKKGADACQGFTLVELMIAIAIIGLLAAIAIPNYISYRKKAQLSSIIFDLKHFEKGFWAYAIDEGDFPEDSHIVLPDLPTMARYVDPDMWGKPTLLGGTYNWEAPPTYSYVGISIFEGTAPRKEFRLLDSMLDDGNLTQGKFRQTSNDRYTYIIDE